MIKLPKGHKLLNPKIHIDLTHILYYKDKQSKFDNKYSRVRLPKWVAQGITRVYNRAIKQGRNSLRDELETLFKHDHLWRT